ncbi:cupin domain-containing protein [Candidatus Pacearchaeota archaeon]|nr:cupin domain-containing protein [Candidatus Pacearchaeota archaeon]
MAIKNVIHQNRGIDHEDERRAILTAFNGDLGGFKAAQAKFYKIYQERPLAGHYHTYVEVFYMLDGEATFTLKDIESNEEEEYVLKSGEVLLIPPKVAHKVIVKKGSIMVGFTEEPFISTEVNDHKYDV